MKILVYLGKATPKVVNGLKSMSDDNDYVVYTSVSSFIQEAEVRHLSVSRAIFNNKFIPRGEEDYVALNEFIRNFSSATELVMVINDGDKESESLFNKYFSSPLHSCAIVKGAASMDFFKDIVSLPITDVKARYYSLDKSNQEGTSDHHVSSKIGSLRGGTKKPAEPKEDVGEVSAVAEPVLNPETLPTVFSDNSIMGNAPEVVSNGGELASTESSLIEDSESVSGFSDDAPVPHAPTGSNPEDFSSEDEDDLLSVGSFGSAHSDTGMFDDDEDPGEIVEEPTSSSVDEEERIRLAELEEQNRIAREVQEREKKRRAEAEAAHSRSSSEEPHIPKGVKKEWGVLKDTPYVANKLNFVSGVHGSGSAQRIVDDAVRMMDAGMSVLIADMDFVSNCLLSFIDVKRYYAKPHNGYIGNNIFVEDNIGVLSGGYGFVPSKDQIAGSLIKAVKSYDIVLIDCPATSLSFVPAPVLKDSNVIVYSGNDPSQIVATSLALSDRNNCTLEQERVIMSKCKCILEGGHSSLVKNTISTMMFANGCWLH